MIVQLEIRHLALVRAVVQEGSLTSASRRLNVTQSALSHQLREIELRLGTPLFHRVRRKLVLTPAGNRVLAAAELVLEEIERAESELRETAAGDSGRLRIATECYTVYHWVPPVLARFSADYPKVNVEIDVTSTRRPLPALLEGKIDLAIITGRAKDRAVKTTPLFRDELLAVMHPEHPLTKEPHLKPHHFAGEHLLTHNVTKEESYIFRVLTSAGVSPRRWSKFELTEAIVQLVAAGYGVSALARWAVEPQLRAGVLQARRITSRGVRRQWSCATLVSAAEPPYLSDFRRLLQQNVRP